MHESHRTGGDEREDSDAPLTILAADGSLEPRLVAGRLVRVSRILHEAVPVTTAP